ncbi:MAG: glucose-6-phosphate dehydrogenase assembly protein OpcA [Nocardioidaceae bacterium]
MIKVEDTNAAGIAAQFVAARRQAGSPAMGMVMTLVIVVEEEHAKTAMAAARLAAREHPARLLGMVLGTVRGASRIDAEVDVGAREGGEQALIRLSGPVTHHAESVVLPLLLPDSPVVVWWPGKAPDEPGADPVGALAKRRITDAAAVPSGKGRAMFTQCRGYTDGNTDLAWTRVTGWRALLASALDQVEAKVSGASVTAERISPSADLLSAWLAGRLKVRVDRHFSKGPGITHVVLRTRTGDVTLARTDGRLATLSSPGQPDRPIALKRRELPELLTEELRRLDPDDAYRDTVKKLLRDHARGAAKR